MAELPNYGDVLAPLLTDGYLKEKFKLEFRRMSRFVKLYRESLLSSQVLEEYVGFCQDFFPGLDVDAASGILDSFIDRRVQILEHMQITHHEIMDLFDELSNEPIVEDEPLENFVVSDDEIWID